MGFGAVWVAKKVPGGHITAHANQARITDFVENDKANFLYSHDVVQFAIDNKVPRSSKVEYNIKSSIAQ